MRKKLLIFLCTIFLLTGCKSNNDHSLDESSEYNSEEISSIESSDDNSSELSSSEENSSEEINEDNSSEEEINLNNILEVKEYGLNFSSPNDIGITFTNKIVQLVGKIVLAKDQVATNGLYGEINQYKALFIDETSYIYLDINYNFYSKIKDYQYKDTTIYSIKGEIISNNNIIEINVNEYTFLNNSSLSFSFSSYYSDLAYTSNYYQIINNIIINNRGCGFSELIKVKAKYIMKLTNTNLLMYDGENYFQLNGHDKIGNEFVLNNTYDLLVIPNLYRYAPGLVYVDKIISQEIIELEDLSKVDKLSSSDLYKIKYSKETTNHSSNYENVFMNIYKFEGYINYYLKNNQINMVMSDNYSSSSYSSYTNALNAKCSFLNNDSEKGLYTDSDLSNSLTYEYALEEIKVSFYYYPYLFNTSNYWMTYIISDIVVMQ